MISNPIEKISDTKILVCANNDKTEQMIVYSNFVDNSNNFNAMVLPVPLAHSVKFIDLTHYTDIFVDCENCFDRQIPKSSALFSNLSANYSNTPLKVFNVGSYKVSLAMNLNDLKYVDSNVFILSPGLDKILKTYYYQPYWGFIICKLASGPENYHPFAYTHEIIDGKIFVPTRHYHQEANQFNFLGLQGYNEDLYLIASNFMENTLGINTYANDWSHDIYFYNINPYLNKNVNKMRSTILYEWKKNKLFDCNKIGENFNFGECEIFEKIKIQGNQPNIDLIVPLIANI